MVNIDPPTHTPKLTKHRKRHDWENTNDKTSVAENVCNKINAIPEISKKKRKNRKKEKRKE